jgi:MoaA/NifB/PqqE/SkfB family radical SAM enzyme
MRKLMENKGSALLNHYPLIGSAGPTGVFDRFMKKIPEAVYIQTINRCNARCVICPYKDTYLFAPTEIMPLDLYQKILRELTPEYGGYIGLYLHCEPLMDNRLPELIALAKGMCPQSHVSISTNASLLNEENIEKICHSPLDSITFNINGGTKETYERMMPPLKWDATIRNIKNFLKHYKGEKEINYIKTNANAHESEYLKEIFSHVTVIDQYWAVNRGGSVTIDKPADAKNRFKSSLKKCKQLSTNVSITSDGSILLCCNCWQKEVILGNAHHSNIIDAWNDKRIKHHGHPVCVMCR